MKVISFLGTADYKPTTYVLGPAEYTTQFFPAAVAHLVRPTELLICATPTVQAHPNLPALTQQLDDMATPWRVIPISEGHSENDLWQIFDALTAAVETREEVTFDVTHSFRSLPILAFLAVAYLKAAKQVKVERMLYGAWEARDKTTNRSPVFDLTPFATLLDWLTATNRFVETGEGQALAKLLQAGMPTGSQMREDFTARLLGKQLKSAAEAINSVSLALSVTRPIEVMQSAVQLENTLGEASAGIAAHARPFSILTKQVVQAYGQFALDHPVEEAQLPSNLWRQLHMVEWYLQRQQVVQAATLAREWLVSVLALKFNEPVFDLKNGREPVESALNNAVERRKPTPRLIQANRCDSKFEALPIASDVVALWSRMRDLRNDIAHVGMNASPKPANLLKQNVEGLYPRLLKIANELLPPENTEAP